MHIILLVPATCERKLGCYARHVTLLEIKLKLLWGEDRAFEKLRQI